MATRLVRPDECCELYSDVEEVCGPDRQAPDWCASPAQSGPDDPTGSNLNGMDQFCNTFRLVLPTGMVFHRKYLKMFSQVQYSALRSYVNSHPGDCGDVAFNFVVANLTGQPGVVLADSVQHVVAELPADESALRDARGGCLAWISRHFDGATLKPFFVEKADFVLRWEDARPRRPLLERRKYLPAWAALSKCAPASGSLPV